MYVAFAIGDGSRDRLGNRPVARPRWRPRHDRRARPGPIGDGGQRARCTRAGGPGGHRRQNGRLPLRPLNQHIIILSSKLFSCEQCRTLGQRWFGSATR
jgi:hypothetical protein